VEGKSTLKNYLAFYTTTICW